MRIDEALGQDPAFQRARKVLLGVFAASMTAFALAIFHWQNMGGHYAPAVLCFVVGLSLTMHLSHKMECARERVEGDMVASPLRQSTTVKIRRKTSRRRRK